MSPEQQEVPPIFRLMQRLGEIPERSIFNTFNMGIGMVLAVAILRPTPWWP